MKTEQKPKTPEIRAAELFKLVNGPGDGGSQFAFDSINRGIQEGWIKLGKFVLSLERKWTQSKKDGSRLNKIAKLGPESLLNLAGEADIRKAIDAL